MRSPRPWPPETSPTGSPKTAPTAVPPTSAPAVARSTQALPLPWAGLRWISRPAWVLGGLALWLLATAWLRPLTLPDEGRYGEVAREMLLGDGITPTLYGLPFFHKPPLTYWLDMAAIAVLGPEPLAARFGPLVGAWLMGAALYLDLRRRAGERVATVSLGVLATGPFYFLAAQYANHDMLVAGLISVAVIAALRALDDAQAARHDELHDGSRQGQGHMPLRWVLTAWVAMALAVLAKGLIGIVLPVLILLPWLALQRRWRQIGALAHPLGVLAFLLLAMPWYLAMEWRHPGFFEDFFLVEHLRRFTQGGFNNVRPFWFFPVVVPLLMLPWSAWLPAVLRRSWEALWRDSTGLGLQGLQLWWILVVLGFFSVPQSKLVGYALPALPPLCALIGRLAAEGEAWRRVMAGAAAFCVLAVALLAWMAPGSHRDLAQELREQWREGDRLVLVDQPFYDLAYLADLARPPIVISDWDDPDIPRRDNWRNELHDSARFDPRTASQVLWRTSRAAELLCTPGTVWFVARSDWRPPQAFKGLSRTHAGRHADLWRASGGAGTACPERP